MYNYTQGKVDSGGNFLYGFRYRGYYYDTESGFYYLQTRYYDPAIGRFINADSYASTGQGILGNNMFAYCNNNPVNLNDHLGCSSKHFNFACGDYPGYGIVLNANIKGAENSQQSSMIDLRNTDEETVLEAEHFALYKGTPVVKVPFMGKQAFSFGIIFMGNDTKNRSDATQLVQHEYGHAVHFAQIGVVSYTVFVGIPSLVGYWTNVPTDQYYSQPWEYCADILGGVNRTYGQRPYPYSISPHEGAMYWLLTLILA